jgi:hypothetical protein
MCPSGENATEERTRYDRSACAVAVRSPCKGMILNPGKAK